MGCCDHSQHGKGMDQVEGSDQDQEETGPETATVWSKVHPENGAELTKVIILKGHHTDGICPLHKVLVYILVHKSPLSLRTSRSARAEPGDNIQKADSREMQNGLLPLCLEKMIQLLVIHWGKAMQLPLL